METPNKKFYIFFGSLVLEMKHTAVTLCKSSWKRLSWYWYKFIYL